MVYADDPQSVNKFLPPLIRLVANPDSVLFFIGQKAVELHPDYAFTVLPGMVEEGSSMAAFELTRFGDEGRKALKALTRSKSAKARIAALTYYTDIPTQFEALDDTDTGVIRQAVMNLLYQSDVDPPVTDRLLQDPRPKVRVAAATLAQRWSSQNWPLWIKLGSDTLPYVRGMAMLHMTSLGLSQGQGPWVSDGIAAVGRGLNDKSPAVRKTAVMAVRGWMLEWEKIPTRWNAAQVARAKDIIASDAFYLPISKLAKLPESSFGSVDVEGIQMARAAQALTISKELRSAGRKVTR